MPKRKPLKSIPTPDLSRIERGVNAGLTLKQARFADLIVEGMPQTDAAMAVYDSNSRKHASDLASENIKQKPAVLSFLVSELKRGRYDQAFINTYDTILGDSVKPGDKDYKEHSKLKLAAQQQIARIAGFEAPKKSQSAVIKLNLPMLKNTDDDN